MLKVAVIGTGFIATQKHLPAWHKIRRQAKVVAVCDVDLQRSEQAARQFGVPKAYDNVQHMLAEEQPDLVGICTPPKTHAVLALAALERGAHLLLEKPMAVSEEECDAIIAAAKEAGRKVCVAHSDLFYPPFGRARELVNRGEIGEFRGMRIFLSTPVDYITSNPDHWAHQLPGGVISETGPHAVYLTLAFIRPIRNVQIHAHKLINKFPWSPFEDYRLDLIGDEAVSSVTLTYTTSHWAAQVDLWGSEGMLKLDLETQTLVRHRRPRLKSATVGFSAFSEAVQILRGTVGATARVLFGRCESTHDSLVRGFVESVENGLELPVTAEEGREAVHVMNLIVDRLRCSTR